MKEVVLVKDLGYLQIDTAASTAAIGPTSYGLGTWEAHPLGTTNVFIMREEIDIAGLTNMELTFYPIGGDVQRGPVSMGQAFAAGGLINEWIYVTATPIEFFPGPSAQTFTLPGQGSNTSEFTNILWGKAWTWVANASLPVLMGVGVNQTLLGSGEPTNGDRLYVYRVVSPLAFSAGVGTFAELPNVRLILSGQLREEAEYSQIMRMRRSYELQQSYDED